MEITLSTRNKSKMVQIGAVFAGTDIIVRSLDEMGIVGDVKEDGTTLGENARKKALFAWEKTHGWCMADDTGLSIDALGGKPGIHAARWAGPLPTDGIRDYTLQQLAHVPVGKRTATFKTAAVVVSPDGTVHTFIGSVNGVILPAPKAPSLSDMPYSGIFMPDGSDKVLAEMSPEELGLYSHRAKAFREVREFLEREMQEGRA